ncbi:hypothetical protein [Micromonospora sp. NPDC001898]|uniref:hypothetical protein n=1 Tax=Micromonospora sp. NPDC001898 TaxID=3364221 RepID=UPI0036B51068
MPDLETDSGIHPSRNYGLDYHAARILLLVSAFGRSRRNGVDGLTKLAKLDFLLRYPAMLERLSLTETNEFPPAHLRASDDERLAVESRMIRYKYGPWDDRYYPILGILLGTGLVKSSGGKGRLRMSVTGDGKRVASQLAALSTWRLTAERCEFIAANFDTTGNRLKDLIYENLPDVVDRPHRTYI